MNAIQAALDERFPCKPGSHAFAPEPPRVQTIIPGKKMEPDDISTASAAWCEKCSKLKDACLFCDEQQLVGPATVEIQGTYLSGTLCGGCCGALARAGSGGLSGYVLASPSWVTV